jgi:hypothetical protein
MGAGGSRSRGRGGGGSESAVGPGAWFDLPDPGVGLVPAVCDGGDGDLGGGPVVGLEAVGAGGGGEQLEGFAVGVELELLVDPVADAVESAGVPARPRWR